MLSIMILSIVICCAILGISLKGYYGYLTEENNQEILEKEKEELRKKEEQERLDRLNREEQERQDRLAREEQERLDRLNREEQERQDRLDKEERDWTRKLQFKDIEIKERVEKEEYRDKYNETHLVNTISFEDLMDNINFLISRVWTHEEHYYLKANDIVVPKIEEESIKFGGMVLQHMSPELRKQALLYYSFDGLLYYIHGVFNDLIWKYATERNELQGLYKYIYSNNRTQLKKDLAQVREDAKNERLKGNEKGKKKPLYKDFEEMLNSTRNDFY
jgi:hypothetical protein